MKIGEYDYSQEIGNGTFSKVYRGVNRETKKEVAIKIINYKGLSSSLRNKIDFEIELMLKIKQNPHPNIILCYDIIKEKNLAYIVMEYCDCRDLSHYIGKPIPEKQVKFFFKQLVSGLIYLDKLGIVHRDIKPNNILLTNDCKTLKIIDFGLSCQESGEMLETVCGSPLYMAPEIIGKNKYDRKSDLWSVGLILYEMLFGKHPFRECRNVREIIEKLENGRIRYKKCISEECLDLLKTLLQKDPKKRITWVKFFAHPWVQEKKKRRKKRTNSKTKSEKIENIENIEKKEEIDTSEYCIIEDYIPKEELHKLEKVNKPAEQSVFSYLSSSVSRLFGY